MKSNIELLKEELARRKQGNIQQTLNELVVIFGRNRRNLSESFRALGDAGVIKVTEMGTWAYQDEL